MTDGESNMSQQTYKGFIIETKDSHWSGIHDNYVSRVIHPDSGVLASFNKVVPAIMQWEQNQADSIVRAKMWIDKQI